MPNKRLLPISVGNVSLSVCVHVCVHVSKETELQKPQPSGSPSESLRISTLPYPHLSVCAFIHSFIILFLFYSILIPSAVAAADSFHPSSSSTSTSQEHNRASLSLLSSDLTRVAPPHPPNRTDKESIHPSIRFPLTCSRTKPSIVELVASRLACFTFPFLLLFHLDSLFSLHSPLTRAPLPDSLPPSRNSSIHSPLQAKPEEQTKKQPALNTALSSGPVSSAPSKSLFGMLGPSPACLGAWC